MADQADIQARIVGLLTAVRHTLGRDANAVDGLSDLMGPLLDGFGPSSIEIHVAEAENLENLAESVVI